MLRLVNAAVISTCVSSALFGCSEPATGEVPGASSTTTTTTVGTAPPSVQEEIPGVTAEPTEIETCSSPTPSIDTRELWLAIRFEELWLSQHPTPTSKQSLAFIRSLRADISDYHDLKTYKWASADARASYRWSYIRDACPEVDG